MRTLSLWVVVVGMLLMGAAMEGLHLNIFIQFSAAVMVFGSVAAFLLIQLGPKGLLALWSKIFDGKCDTKDVSVLERATILGFMAGGFSTITGFIHVLQNLADSSKIGAGLAVAFVGALYGMVPALLVSILPTKTGTPAKIKKAAPVYVAASIALLLFSFYAAIYSLSGTTV